MRNPTRALAVVTVTMLALVGCTGTDGKNQPQTTVTTTTSPAVTPTPVTTTSSPTPTPKPTPTVTYDQKLAQEAMTVNERQNQLEGQYFKEGGWPKGLKVPPELLAVMMDTGLEKSLDLIHQTYDSGVQYQSGDLKMSNVTVSDAPPHNGSLIALQSCRDGRGVRNKRKDGSTSTGALILHTSYYKRDTDGKLKMSHWVGKRVETCGS